MSDPNYYTGQNHRNCNGIYRLYFVWVWWWVFSWVCKIICKVIYLRGVDSDYYLLARLAHQVEHLLCKQKVLCSSHKTSI